MKKTEWQRKREEFLRKLHDKGFKEARLLRDDETPARIREDRELLIVK